MRGKLEADIFQEIKTTLTSKERFGQSKHEAKREGRATEGIYSVTTSVTYRQACNRFGEYVAEHRGRHTTLEEAKDLVRPFIEERAGTCSPYTLKMEVSALNKLYGTKFDIKTADRHRADISRSRERTVVSEKTGKEIKNPSSRAGHFSEKRHADLIEFLRSTGLRRSEIESLRGNQLYQSNGQYYIYLEKNQCKGGRDRFVPIRAEGLAAVVDRMRSVGSAEVFEQVPKRADIHHYRSQYATALYKELSRPLHEIPRHERYYCRAELKGQVYDKVAMLEVSKALGHNRISVIAEHYLRED